MNSEAGKPTERVTFGPVAWMYSRKPDDWRQGSVVQKHRLATDHPNWAEWTETPLYAQDPAEAVKLALEAAADTINDMLAAAYAAWATDVHNHWAAGNVEIDPDFTEAASDYAALATPEGIAGILNQKKDD